MTAVLSSAAQLLPAQLLPAHLLSAQLLPAQLLSAQLLPAHLLSAQGLPAHLWHADAVRAAEDSGKAGPLGLLVLILLGVASYFLFRSMSRHLRRVREDFPVEPVDPAKPEPPDFG